MSREIVCRKARNLKTARHRYAWADEVTNGFRHIYIRCLGCRTIFELVEDGLRNREGIRFKIDPSNGNVVWPCVVCPHCSVHAYTKLYRYVKTDVPDLFSKRNPKRRYRR